MHCLVTAVTSPVGRKVAATLLHAGHRVLGLTDLNAHEQSQSLSLPLFEHHDFHLVKLDLRCRSALMQLFGMHQPDVVVHLGARQSVSPINDGVQCCEDVCQRVMLNLLDGSVLAGCAHVIYCQAESLSRRGEHRFQHHLARLPQVEARLQLLAHTHSLLYRLPTSGLCFNAELVPDAACELRSGYYGRDLCTIAHQLVQLVKTGPVAQLQANPYFALYQVAQTQGQRDKQAKWPGLASRQSRLMSDNQHLSNNKQQKFSQ